MPVEICMSGLGLQARRKAVLGESFKYTVFADIEAVHMLAFTLGRCCFYFLKDVLELFAV